MIWIFLYQGNMIKLKKYQQSVNYDFLNDLCIYKTRQYLYFHMFNVKLLKL